ncbi:MAG TPA: class I SAM-dependent DNA methyltransferase [Ktedonobacteraceae bacterium]|nr:class I SAM-dependent DNA methyltransferase [Ktedonobacteraceae bacterium]
MSTQTQYIVQKLWNYCNILRDDGMSYGDYVEQLTYLLFLKMAHERTLPPFDEKPRIPIGLGWETLRTKDGVELETLYKQILSELGSQEGMLGIIFRKAINKIQNPAHLRRLIADLIDDINWLKMEADVKGDAYEGLLQKNAEDTKSGAGQYFTPRDLIKAIVEVMQPRPLERICDPASGTGGFLLAAHDYISEHYALSRDERRFLKNEAFRGWEIVDSTARLCVMNMFLHGIGDERAPDAPIHVFDSLRAKPSEHFDMVLTNPPFGRKSSLSLGPGNGSKKNGSNGTSDEREAVTVNRDDFWATTSNKQLNFVQHVYSLLRPEGGRAAVVVPDNVLFEGGAGETIRRNLLQNCDVHTMLRLPTGIFYAQGVKANVLFFDKHQASPNVQTKQLWIYDLRTNMNFTLRTNPLTRAHLDDFVACYHPENRNQRQESERFRAFSYEELAKRDKLSLDLFWLRDESLEGTDNLLPPAEIAASIVEDLQNALEQFMAIAEDLGKSGRGKVGQSYHL